MPLSKLSSALLLLIGLFLSASPRLHASTHREIYYVNNVAGSDEYDGMSQSPGADRSGPFATIAKALKACGVGARIELANTGVDYRERVAISGLKKGLADSPLSINGNGAYVSGLVVVPADRWVLLKEDVYYFLNQKTDETGKVAYEKMPTNNWLLNMKHQGWFEAKEVPEIFFLDGKPAPSTRSLADIAPGGFFYDTQGATLPAAPGRPCVFFRVPAGRNLGDCRIELPLSGSVYVGDDYVTVSNLGSRYSVEDGFDGFWGQGVVFRNIHACYNTEQGVSFHGNGTALVDGALIERNGGCGIVDVMSSTSIYRNVTVRGNFPGGVLFRGFAHAMYGSRIIGNRGVQLEVSNKASVSLVNTLIAGQSNVQGTTPAVQVYKGYARIDRCTIANSPVGLSVQDGCSVIDSIIADCPNILAVAPNAVGGFSMRSTLLGRGKILLGEQSLDEASRESLLKPYPGVVVDMPNFEGALFSLPKDSPYRRAGASGGPLGATPAPEAAWSVPGDGR
ncbi:MAG TPA: right-handed parallel beta-helix repeat-containing protein [Rariglobus sp.]